MTDPLLTILIPTIGQRDALLRRLLAALLPQLDEHDGAVRVLAWRNNGQPSLGEVRDGLMHHATSEYVVFVDDDDMVPEYYVSEIMKALEQRPDHIGYQVEFSTNGTGREVVDHSLRHGRWYRNPDGQLCRDFTHIDPVRRELALRGSFIVPRPGRAEDRHWVKQLRGWLSTEAYIDKIMYYYLWREDTSAWQRPAFIIPQYGRPEVDSPYFTWHPGSDA